MSEATAYHDEIHDREMALLDAFEEHADLAQFRTIKDRILVDRLERPDTQKRGDLHVVKSTENKNWLHFVLRVGGSVDLALEPGDIIITGRRVGQTLTWEGEQLRLVKEKDVLALFDPDEDDLATRLHRAVEEIR